MKEIEENTNGQAKFQVENGKNLILAKGMLDAILSIFDRSIEEGRDIGGEDKTGRQNLYSIYQNVEQIVEKFGSSSASKRKKDIEELVRQWEEKERQEQISQNLEALKVTIDSFTKADSYTKTKAIRSALKFCCEKQDTLTDIDTSKVKSSI